MKTVGIIAEYNPFHRGHAYHIEKTRQITGADYVIVAMSGDFVQRGEPACTDKYFRARMALLGGADLVVELPVVYAAASAELFAAGGVKLLSDLSCIDGLSFGSEWGDLEDYEPLVDYLAQEGEDYRDLLQSFLKQGDSFPLARSKALEILIGERDGRRPLGWTESFLKEPNHILGLEYLKAIRRQESSLKPVIIKRKGAGYHDKSLNEGFPSAAAIRDQLAIYMKAGESSAIAETLKKALGDQGESFLDHVSRGNYVTWDDLMPLLDYRILMTGQCGDPAETAGPSNPGQSACDLAARIHKQYRPGLSFEQLVDLLHTKNRTDTALKRELLHILLGTKEAFSRPTAMYNPNNPLQIDKPETSEKTKKQEGPISLPCARVLGFRRSAGPLLKRIREESRIPVIQRPVEGLSPGSDIYKDDLRAADLYEQVAARKCGRQVINELRRQQVILD